MEIGRMEDLNTEASNFMELRQFVSALVAVASGLHSQVEDKPQAISVRTLALMSDPTVNGHFIPAARTPPHQAPSALRLGSVKGPRGFAYNSHNFMECNVATGDTTAASAACTTNAHQSHGRNRARFVSPLILGCMVIFLALRKKRLWTWAHNALMDTPSCVGCFSMERQASMLKDAWFDGRRVHAVLHV